MVCTYSTKKVFLKTFFKFTGKHSQRSHFVGEVLQKRTGPYNFLLFELSFTEYFDKAIFEIYL